MSSPALAHTTTLGSPAFARSTGRKWQLGLAQRSPRAVCAAAHHKRLAHYTEVDEPKIIAKGMAEAYDSAEIEPAVCTAATGFADSP